MIQHILSDFPPLPNCDADFSDNNQPCYTDNGSGELGMNFRADIACI